MTGRESLQVAPFLLVGLGSIGRRHAQTLRSLGVGPILAVRSARGPTVSMRGVSERPTFRTALAEKPTALIVSNPTSMHLSSAFAGARAGLHLFIEKPLSQSLRGLGRLERLARKKQLVVQVGYQFRYHALFRRVKRLLDCGAIGRVLSARAWVSRHLRDWHPGEDYKNSYVARRDLGGGVVLTLSHELDYLYWFLGRPRWVSAASSEPGRLGIETESLAEVTLGYRDGLLAHVHMDCLSLSPARGFELIGAKGNISMDILRGRVGLFIRGTRPRFWNRAGAAQEALKAEMRWFLRCISRGGQPVPDLHEARDVLAIACAAAESSLHGKRARPRYS